MKTPIVVMVGKECQGYVLHLKGNRNISYHP